MARGGGAVRSGQEGPLAGRSETEFWGDLGRGLVPLLKGRRGDFTLISATFWCRISQRRDADAERKSIALTGNQRQANIRYELVRLSFRETLMAKAGENQCFNPGGVTGYTSRGHSLHIIVTRPGAWFTENGQNMPFKETTVMEQRKEFIRKLHSGELDISKLCRKHGISRPTGYKRGSTLPRRGRKRTSTQNLH